MTPDRNGVWEWYDKDNVLRRVIVFNVAPENYKPHFRVCWGGGYYNVNDESEGESESDAPWMKAEWTGGVWGNYLGKDIDFKEEELYLY